MVSKELFLGEGARGRQPTYNPPPNPLPTNLVLIGTVHGDPQGYVRAWKLLSHLKPDLVTVEVSRFSLRYRQRQERRWQRQLAQGLAELPEAAREHLAVRRLAAQVALPFEVRVARDWGRQQGRPWRPLDLGGPARRHLTRYVPEMLTVENLRGLLATPDGSLEDFVAAEFRRAKLVSRRPPWRLPPSGNAENLRRERLLARRLQALVLPGRRLVHLGGWEHLVPWRDGSGLGHLLADLKPLRLLLHDADFLPGGQISW